MPSYAGEKLFLRLGYKKIGTLRVASDEDGEGFDIAVVIHEVAK